MEQKSNNTENQGNFPIHEFNHIQMYLYVITIAIFFLRLVWSKLCSKNKEKEVDIFKNLGRFYASEGLWLQCEQNEELFDFSQILCGCNFDACSQIRAEYSNFIIKLKKKVLKSLFSHLKVISFFFKYMIFFNKPLEGICNILKNYVWWLKYIEFLFSVLDFFYIIFMISFIGNRRELIKLSQDLSEDHERVNFFVHYHLKKAIKFSIIYFIFLMISSSMTISVLGDDENSLMFYIIRNIFFLLIMNYRNGLIIYPIINNDQLKQGKDILNKVDKFAKEIIPPKKLVVEIIELLTRSQFEADRAIERYFHTHNFDYIAKNFSEEINNISESKFETIVLPRGESYAKYCFLLIYIIFDQLLSIIISFIYLIARDSYNVFMAYKISTFIKLVLEMFFETWLFLQVIKTTNLYGNDHFLPMYQEGSKSTVE